MQLNRLLRLGLLSFTLIASSACHKWSTMKGPIDGSISSMRPELVRVTEQSGTILEMRSPTVRGDSLVGLPTHGPQPVPGQTIAVDTLAIALSDIARIERWTSDRLATTAIALGLYVGTSYVIESGTDRSF